MDKINIKKELINLYNASAKSPSIVEVPKMAFLKIDGVGSPKEKGFQDAASTLYPIAYTLKFMVREVNNIDYGVLPMEILWKINRENKGDFKWTMMLMQPEYITRELYERACDIVGVKFDLPLLTSVRFESYTEGLCAQMMHKGHYTQMNNTLEKMLTFIKEQGYTSERDTHDIYLNDVRKTKTENLKTIMRLPINR